MKKYIILTTIILLLISTTIGCNIEIKNDNDSENTTALPTLEQKMSCANYEENALAQINDNYNYGDESEGVVTIPSLEKIFYSPKVNSCLYIMTNRIIIDTQSCKVFKLIDVLTREEIIDEYSCETDGVITSTNNISISQAYENFETQVTKYDPDFKGIENGQY